jgi:predicted transposase YdaD
MHQDKDRGSQWLFAHFGSGILRLAGVADIADCKAIKQELVAPRRLPDGLLEVSFKGRPEKTLYLVEIESYADVDADRQMFENLLLVAADRRELPEAIVLVLRPKGNAEVKGQYRQGSQTQGTSVQANWQVIQLWDLKAADLLGQNDVGVIPWLPLTQFDGPPDALLRLCRERIDRDAPAERRDGLLAVTQIMAGFAMMEKQLMSILSPSSPLFDTPYMREVKEQLKQRLEQEVRQEVRQEVAQEVAHNTLVSAINDNLSARFQTVPDELRSSLSIVTDQKTLVELHKWSAICPDLTSFRARLIQQ